MGFALGVPVAVATLNIWPFSLCGFQSLCYYVPIPLFVVGLALVMWNGLVVVAFAGLFVWIPIYVALQFYVIPVEHLRTLPHRMLLTVPILGLMLVPTYGNDLKPVAGAVSVAVPAAVIVGALTMVAVPGNYPFVGTLELFGQPTFSELVTDHTRASFLAGFPVFTALYSGGLAVSQRDHSQNS